MFLLPLLLSVALDMSLPEFEPSPDASGNYIVSSVVDDEVVVEELTEKEFEELPLSTPMLRAVETHHVDASTLSNYRVSGNALQAHSGDILYYIYLTAGIEYTITSGQNLYTCKGLWKNAVCTPFTDSTITPSENLYLVRNNASLSVSYTTGEPDPEPDDPSGNDPDDPSGNDPDDPSGNDPDDPSGNDPDNPSGGDFDDSRLLIALDSITGQLSVIELLLIFNCLFPLTRKTVHKLMNRKED